MFFFAYFTSQPPHSTTVKPSLANGVNVCGSMFCGLPSGFHAMNTRRTLSGVGSISSLAASVYTSDWNEIRLYGLSCIFGSQYTINSLYSRGVRPISVSFSRRKSAVSAPATQKPLETVSYTHLPGIPAVQQLVVDGAAEIVKNYDVDGLSLIHI